MPIHDITFPITPEMVTWNDAEAGCMVEWVVQIEENGSPCNVSKVSIGSHLGTHLDAPLHFIAGGATLETLDLNRLIGPCLVIELPDLAEINITAADLERASIPPGTKRLLFKTSNSRQRLLEKAKFCREFVAIAPDAARWLVSRGVEVVGVDYLSVGSAVDGTGVETHRVLLGAGLIAIEGLYLSDTAPGLYTLICLPLKVTGAEGGPVRAVLISD
ncbi:MAG TPA: cyclase family protein [Capsulimonadaceae bacterium]|nr:cyclase family protein [Capsulimonadaceae bacterium]